MIHGLIAPHGGELILNMASEAERASLRERAHGLPHIEVGSRQLADLEKKLTARLDRHEVAIVEVLRRVMDILDPPPLPEPPPPLLAYLILKFTLEAGSPAGRELLKSIW